MIQSRNLSEKNSKLNLESKTKLAHALLECRTVSRRQTRNTLIEELPFKAHIWRSDIDFEDVINLINGALDYPNGIDQLLKVIRTFEGDSIRVRKLDSTVQEIRATLDTNSTSDIETETNGLKGKLSKYVSIKLIIPAISLLVALFVFWYYLTLPARNRPDRIAIFTPTYTSSIHIMTATPTVTITTASTATITPTITPTPTPTPSPTIIEEPYSFNDDFNTVIEPEWDIESGMWNISNDRLELLGYTEKQASISIGALTSKDYTISFEAGGFEKITSRSFFPELGRDLILKNLIIIVRASRNESEGLQGVLFSFSSHRYQCGSYYDDSLHDSKAGPQFFGWQGPYDVRITVKDNTYIFYLNDERVCTFQTDRFSEGQVLLVGTDGEGNMTWIDNFTLTIQD